MNMCAVGAHGTVDQRLSPPGGVGGDGTEDLPDLSYESESAGTYYSIAANLVINHVPLIWRRQIP
jgi:hypothetical protein